MYYFHQYKTVHPLYEQIISENIDVLEWHNTMSILLVGSKSQNLVKLYNVRNGLEIIQEFKPEFDDKSKKIINYCFMPVGYGIASANEKQVIINNYKYGYTECIGSQKINEVWENISFFKIKSSSTSSNIIHNNNMFIVDTIYESPNKIQSILYVKRYIFYDSNSFSYEDNFSLNSSMNQKLGITSSFQNKNLNTYLKHIDYAKKKYGKSIFIEDKIGENKTYNVRLSYDLLVVKLKVIIIFKLGSFY